MLKIASWNVNSIRIRMPHLQEWLAREQIDIVALQETKCVDDKFPLADVQALAYQAEFCGQKSYNGVSTLSRQPAERVFTDTEVYGHEQKRFLATVHQGILVVNVYVPNGQAVGSEKFAYKLSWLSMLLDFIRVAQQTYDKIIILGDFNIAPSELDHTPVDYLRDEIMRSSTEQALFQQLLALGFVDSFRQLKPDERQYSWWDYRLKAFERNLGYRIDHILVSAALAAKCLACEIDTSLRTLVQPSDHTPIILTLDLA